MEPWMISLGAGLLTVGGAYGGTRAALNGTRERVKELAKELDEHKDDTIDRLARIETKLDFLKESSHK